MPAVEIISGNIFIRKRPMARAGDLSVGHKHNFDHTTIVFRGAVRVRRWAPPATQDDQPSDTKDFHAPAHFLVRAGDIHEITALIDDTEFWCVYSHRDPHGNVVQQDDGWTEAYR
jgi:predicted metal-dependent enzyme (double-stranded beta helix superfamily)